MSDLVLSDGREIVFDLSTLTLGEYRALFDPKSPDKKDDETISRCCGLEVKEYYALPFQEHKRIIAAFLKKCREPLSDPN